MGLFLVGVDRLPIEQIVAHTRGTMAPMKTVIAAVVLFCSCISAQTMMLPAFAPAKIRGGVPRKAQVMCPPHQLCFSSEFNLSRYPVELGLPPLAGDIMFLVSFTRRIRVRKDESVDLDGMTPEAALVFVTKLMLYSMDLANRDHEAEIASYRELLRKDAELLKQLQRVLSGMLPDSMIPRTSEAAGKI